jgi:hypothetical protein
VNDHLKLASVDGAADWRQQESKALGDLVQARIRHLQVGMTVSLRHWGTSTCRDYRETKVLGDLVQARIRHLQVVITVRLYI